VHVPEPYGVARNEAVSEDLRAHDLFTELENNVFHFCYPPRNLRAKPDLWEVIGVEPRSAVVPVRLLLTMMAVASLGPPCRLHVFELDQRSRSRQSAAVV
jgi:hypothetical protein